MRRCVAGLLAVLLAVPAAFGQAPASMPIAPKEDHPIRGNEITPDSAAAVDRGLAALARRQGADGSFKVNDSNKHAGITALAALAFMQAGNLPDRGKYGANVRRALEFVLSCSQESGVINFDNAMPTMYGHGFATLFLAEVYGMGGDDRVRVRLQRAVRLIEQSQNPQGGWRYNPVPADADISVTICQIMALRAARDAGIKVEKSVIDKAVEYVKQCQNNDGGFSYMLNMGGSGFARSAAGLASLYYAGIYEGDNVDRALRYLERTNDTSRSVDGHYYYGHYYAVQAMFLAGGEHWGRWFPKIRDQLVKTQNKQTGVWTGEYGTDYVTAMALIILQMPNRYLPVYAGKGPGG